MTNQFMLKKIDEIQEKAGKEGLRKELNRERLYVDRMENDATYKNNRAIQNQLKHRKEYIESLVEKLRSLP